MPPNNSKGLVLIAEDVKVISHKMTSVLRRVGYEVALAEDGLQCLEMARSLHPELILLDIMMPNMHGIDVMKRLRADEQTKDIGVIVCTAKSFETEHQKMLEMGAYDFLIKPFSMPALIEMVDGYFSRHTHPREHSARPQGHCSTSGELFAPRVETKRGTLTIWGTRGSTPTPGAAFLRHGGQTSCMTFATEDTICIFDAGSGIRDLGLELAKSKFRNLHLFITHTHWDHIQGFPFFVPAYDPGFNITVYGAPGFGKDLKSLFSGQLDRDYFPVQIEDMKAKLEFVHLGHDPIQLGNLKITWEFSNHPGATVGYKIEIDGTRVAWVPDNEFLEGYIGAPDSITRDDERVAPYLKMIEFLSDVDLLIHEAQYTNEEYAKKIGWGHSGLSNACVLVSLADVPRWIVTHHDPMHDDRFLETKLNLTKQLLARIGHPIEVEHGHDGMTLHL